MILQALTKYYEVLAEDGKVTRPGWSTAKVSAALRISKDGELLGIIPLTEEIVTGKKTVRRPQQMDVPEQVTRASGISPNFLCDNSSYLLGIDGKGKPERSKKCFEASKEHHLNILSDVCCEAAEAVKAFFNCWDVDKAEINPFIQDNIQELFAASNLIFVIDSDFAHNDSEIKKAWASFYGQRKGGQHGICLVTGEHTSIARIHGLIKGVPGAQSSGASLVGFNAPAFQSYGKEQSYNAPVGEYAVYAYTTALNYLLGRRELKSQIGDTTVVYWAESGEDIYTDLAANYMNPTMDNQDTVRSIFKSLENGWNVNVEGVLKDIDPDQKFYILGLSPNAARLAVRFFYCDTFGNTLRHLKEHYDRMEIVRPASDTMEHLGIWRTLQEIANKKSKDKKPPDNVSGAFFRAVLDGGRYPEGLYQAVLQRIRADQDNSDARIYKITRGRVAIIKAYLIRNTRVGEEEEITVGLNENSKNVPYVLGRMFAVLEKIQMDAMPEINSTIKDRYFNSACATPASIFPVLLKLKNSHTKKLVGNGKKGAEIFYERKLQELQEKIPVGDETELAYPKRLSLTEQGMFILGYYQQMQNEFEGKKKEEK